MSHPIAVRLGRLADRLGELRSRLKDAARFEVAQAVADALGEAARAMICGPMRPQGARCHDPASAWDDPWRDPFENPTGWTDRAGADEAPQSNVDLVSLQAALTTGLAIGRWSFARTGQLVPALGLAAAVAIALLLGRDKIAPLLEVCATTHDLLAFPNRRA